MKPVLLFAVTATAAGALLISRLRVEAPIVVDPGVPGEPGATLGEYDPTGSMLGALQAAFSQAAGQLAGAVRRVFALPAAAAPYAESIRAAEQANGIPDSLLGRLLYQESRYRPDVIQGTVRSSAGALGIAQFMPATAREQGVNPLDPYQAIDGAARYLRRLFDALGSWDKALAAYNWGIGNVQRQGMAAAPAETRAYVAEILADVDVS